jgi:hypothetical protein
MMCQESGVVWVTALGLSFLYMARKDWALLILSIDL